MVIRWSGPCGQVLLFFARSTYDTSHSVGKLFGSRDEIAIQGLADLTPGKTLTVQGTRANGETYTFAVKHTFNENQIGAWNA